MADMSDQVGGRDKEDLDVSDQAPQDVRKTATETKEHEYVTGLKLGIAISSTTVVVFLMMLDLSIIVTVSET